VPFVVTCMAILAGALLAALLLNTQLAAGAYEQRSMDVELAQLARDEQSLSAELDTNKSPAKLAESAAALGMVPAGSTGWLRLSDGTVQGDVGAGQ
jgi:cell division protein FtsX